MSMPGTFINDLVRTILIMTLSGSVLTLILVLIKPLVRNRIPQAAQYGLWLVVLASLLIPVSRFPVLPNIPLTPIHAVVEYTFRSAEDEINRINSNALPPGMTNLSGTEEAPGTTTGPEHVPLTGIPRLFVGLFLGFIFIYPWAALLFLLYSILTYTYFMGKIRFRRALPMPDSAVISRQYKGKRAPRLYICPLASTPMLVGLIRPRILLPEYPYTETQLRSILQHELTHLRRRDVIVKWLSILACALHWFNPLVWLVKREIDRSCELSCDAAVISHLNTNGKKNYGETLISMAADIKAPRSVLSATMCEESKDLKERLLAIMNYKQHRQITVVVSALIITGAIGAFCVLGAAGDASAVGTGQDLIPDSAVESLIPFGNLTGKVSGVNKVTLTLETTPANVYEGNASLKIQQNTGTAFAGFPLILEPGCTYEFDYYIKALHDANGYPVNNVNASTVFVFYDPNAHLQKNHYPKIPGPIALSTDGDWVHVRGVYTIDSTLHPDATPETGWFVIYMDGSMTYVIDNVRLVQQGKTGNLIPNGDFEILSYPLN